MDNQCKVFIDIVAQAQKKFTPEKIRQITEYRTDLLQKFLEEAKAGIATEPQKKIIFKLMEVLLADQKKKNL